MTNKNNKDEKELPENKVSDKVVEEPKKAEEPAKEEAIEKAVTDKEVSLDTANEVKDEATPPQPKAPAKPTNKKQDRKGVKVASIAIILSIVLSGGLAFHMQQKDAQYQAQIQALSSQLEQTRAHVSSELSDTKQQAINQAKAITHRAETVLEQQQKSIESLQIAVSDVKGRRPNDWLLAEADYLVKLAGRKLFLEHDVTSATSLMESADQRIAALNDPSLVPLRQSLANDIVKLKSVPLIDRDGLVLRLTALQQQVDTLPLANAILPEAQAVEKRVVSEDINDWQTNLKTSLKDFSENFITFRSRDGNVIPLLSPEQHFFLKENLKAKIETAIKAVYVEQQEIYTTALSTADSWSASFFNTDDNTVAEFNKTLSALSKQTIQVEYPVKLETQQILSDVIRERLRREVTTLVTEDK